MKHETAMEEIGLQQNKRKKGPSTITVINPFTTIQTRRSRIETMTAYTARLPAIDFYGAAKRTLQQMRRGVSFIANRVTETGANDLANLDNRALADAGYDRIDWESETGEAIQKALIKIYDW
ncbi:MAG: hypothetical protein ABJR23_14225 [Paracoccaceae bacterium]